LFAVTAEDDLLAAELALGLLDGEERLAAARRLLVDPDFAAAHDRWLGYGPALLGGADTAPPEAIWSAIVARLPANDAAPPVRVAAARGWKLATLVASAAAILLAVVVVDRPAVVIAPAAGSEAPPLTAMLTGAESKAVVAVSYDIRSQRLTMISNALDLGAHSAELWVIPADKRPRSLGVIAPGHASSHQAPASAADAIAAGATLAVTVEPAGGSPDGKPGGPPILTGIVVAS
jgi:anti-sigma-K factor RskA